MKQLVILSGKGGTGKTSLGAAFAHLSSQNDQTANSIFVDADVDAANLSLVLSPQGSEQHDFWGGSLAEIDTPLCIGCGACVPVCRYDAVLLDPDHPPAYLIDPIACDGCAACVYACPVNAISMVKQQEGYWYRSTTPYGVLYHAELFAGRENSGKLVTQVKQQARLWAETTQASSVIIDGPPGIGCPVISACAGVNLGLLVAEPSVAGLHDLKRIYSTLKHFKIPSVLCINKSNIYPQGARQIKEYAVDQGIEVLGEIPYDEAFSQAMIQGLPITELFPESEAAQAIQDIWQKILTRLNPQEE